MIEKFIRMFGISAVLILFCSGADLLSGQITGIEAIYCFVSPETGSFILMGLVANFLLSLMTILVLLERCDQHTAMLCFEFRSRERGRLLISQKKDMYCYFLAVVAGEVAACGLGGMLTRMMTWSELGYLLLHFVLTALLWMEMLFFLRCLRMSSKMSFFFVIALTLISAVFLRTVGSLSLFVYGDAVNAVADALSKLLLAIILCLASGRMVMKMDFL